MQVISAGQLRRLHESVAPPSGPMDKVMLEIAGVTVQLGTQVSGLADEIRAKFADHVTSRRADFSYYVWDMSGAYQFWCRHDGGWSWHHGGLPTSAIAFLTDATLMSALIHFDADLRSIHAAALAWNGSGAILAGSSTTGKTTTLLACARAGFHVYSDERALLRGSMLQPFLRRCAIRSHGRELLLDDMADDTLASHLLSGEELSLRDCFGSAVIAEPAPLRAVFILSGYGSEPAIERIDAASALPPVARWFDMRAGSLNRLAVAVGTLRAVGCFRLRLGTPRETAVAIRDALERL